MHIIERVAEFPAPKPTAVMSNSFLKIQIRLFAAFIYSGIIYWLPLRKTRHSSLPLHLLTHSLTCTHTCIHACERMHTHPPLCLALVSLKSWDMHVLGSTSVFLLLRPQLPILTWAQVASVWGDLTGPSHRELPPPPHFCWVRPLFSGCRISPFPTGLGGQSAAVWGWAGLWAGGLPGS